MTGSASFAIGDPNQLEVQTLSSVDQPEARVRFLDAHAERGSFRFSIGAHHRFKSLDLGAKITHQLAQPTMLEGVERRLPGYVEGLLHLRWRFFDRHWGAFYGGIGVGGAVSRPSRGFRASVAFQFEGTPDLTATDERLFALAASSSAGVLVYHGDDLGFFLEFVGTVIAAEYRVADHDALISGRNECIQAGVTWSL